MASHPGEPVSEDVPPEALDLARSLVRRGIELDALLHAYRRGQNVAWRRWMEAAAATVPDGPELIELLDVSSELMFGYVDAGDRRRARRRCSASARSCSAARSRSARRPCG